MISRPERKKNESILAHYLRVIEWEKAQHKEAQIESRVIDRLSRRAKFSNEKAVTRQVQHDRRSLHDIAQTNPVLLRILRRMK